MTDYKLGEITFSTGMTTNPVDGELYVDHDTFKIYMAMKGKWERITVLDQRELDKIALRNERKQKINKLDGR